MDSTKLIRRRRTGQQRRGAAAVEFAISISILFVIVFASIEFVRLNMLEHSVDHASYLAARKGILMGATVGNVKTVAKDHLALFGVSNATVTVSPNPIDDDASLIEVTIDVPMSGNTWISPIYFSGTINGRTRMLAERSAAQMAGAIPAGP